MKHLYLFLIAGTGSLIFSLLVHKLFITVWNRKHISRLTSQVRSDRWGDRAVPVTGGIIVNLSVCAAFLFLSIQGLVERDIIVSFLCGFCMFLLGLADDLFEFRSYQKFIGQLFFIAIAVVFGVRASIFNNVLDLVITFIWYLFITNAMNLLDNMDGLSGGIALIVVGFLSYFFFKDGKYNLLILVFIFAAALMGFLVYNFKPAKVFLGDNGSLSIGFFLALLTILTSNSQVSGRSVIGVIILPVSLLMIPIFDTILVSITRKLRGKSPFHGGRDHLSHRLVTLGLSERQAVLFLYAVSVVFGLLFIVLKGVLLIPAIVIYVLLTMFVLFFGLYIGKIRQKREDEKRGGENEKTSGKPSKYFVIGGNYLYKTQILKVIGDIIILPVIYYLSYLLRFGGRIDPFFLEIFKQSVLIIVAVKIVCMGIFRVYTIRSEYGSFRDVLAILKSITIVTFLAILLATVWRGRFDGFSRAVFVIDWALGLIVLSGTKLFYRFFDELFYPLRARNNKKILYIGNYGNMRMLEYIIRERLPDEYVIDSYFANTEEYDKSTIKDIDTVICDNNMYTAVRDSNVGVGSLYTLDEFVKKIF